MTRSYGLSVILRVLLGSLALSFGCSGDPGAKGDPGPQGAPGQQGDPGTQGQDGVAPGSINAVSPRDAYLGRTLEVAISGDATLWTDAAKVSFGAGVNVDSLIVASSTSLIVTITIDESADLGDRDVTVTNKDAKGLDVTLTYKGGFHVAAPLSIDSSLGAQAQGSIFMLRLSQRDLSAPFDTGGAPEYPNLSVEAGPGMSFAIQEATTYGINSLGFVDVDAPAATADLYAMSGTAGSKTSSIAPAALSIGARASVPLTAGGSNAETQGPAFESKLFSFTPQAHKLVSIAASSTDPAASPAFALLPPNGKFADIISYGPVGRLVTETADPFFVVYWDNSGAKLYDFDIKVDVKDSDDIEPNNGCGGAQVVGALPASLVNLSLSSVVDEDWFKITATAADVGKVVHVLTKPGDPNTNTYVEVFSGGCASLTPLGGPSGDVGYHEDHASGPIPAAGDYWVKIAQSPASPYTGSLYDLDIDLRRSEIEPNDMCVISQALSIPTTLDIASLSSATDQDWYTLTIAPADVGKLIHVTTSPGDPLTDTYIELFSGSCMVPVLFAKSSDGSAHENFQSPPIPAAGVYHMRISNSPTFPYSGKNYKLSIELAAAIDIEPTNNTCIGATPTATPAMLSPMHLSSIADQDWLQFTATAADVGKVVHVVTSSPDLCDTVVDVRAGASCGVALSLGGPSADGSFDEDFTSTPIVSSGPFWVKVSYSPFGGSGTEYTVKVTLE